TVPILRADGPGAIGQSADTGDDPAVAFAAIWSAPHTPSSALRVLMHLAEQRSCPGWRDLARRAAGVLPSPGAAGRALGGRDRLVGWDLGVAVSLGFPGLAVDGGGRAAVGAGR